MLNVSNADISEIAEEIAEKTTDIVTNHISFPGFGWEFNIKETAIANCFGIDGFNIQWYGIILAIGISLAFLLFYRLAVKKEEIDPDTVYNIALIAVPVAIVGARAFYVISEWDRYAGDFKKIINIREGGIAIYGAIIFGLAAVLIYAKIKKRSPFSILDALAPAVMLGQATGRWGNFVNAEAYGWSEGVDKLPWRMVLDNYVINKVYNPEGVTSVHPTFFYESLWNVIGLIIILAFLYRKKKFDGEIFFAYMGWYGLGRAVIEMIRSDSLRIPGTTLKLSVCIGIICVIASVIGLLVLAKRKKEEDLELSEYKSAFSAITAAISKEQDALASDVYDTEYNESEAAAEESVEDETAAEETAEETVVEEEAPSVSEEASEEIAEEETE